MKSSARSAGSKSRRSQRAEQLEAAPGQVLGGGVEQRAVVGERDVVQIDAVVVGVERRPAAVLVLHPEEPAEPALLGQPRAIGIHTPDRSRAMRTMPCRRGRGSRVVVLERPAAWLHVRALHLPVARHQDLLGQHPVRGPLQRRVIGGRSLDQRVRRQRGVPHRRGAGLIVELVAVLDGERLDLLELAQDQRVVLGIAEHAQGQHELAMAG